MTDADYQDAIAKLNHQIELTKSALVTQQALAEPTWWSTTNAMTISAAVLIFGFFICSLSAYLLRQGKTAELVLRTMGTLLVIISALFLVVAGYSDKQIAPVIGLLGTIVGYLLGRGSSESKA